MLGDTTPSHFGLKSVFELYQMPSMVGCATAATWDQVTKNGGDGTIWIDNTHGRGAPYIKGTGAVTGKPTMLEVGRPVIFTLDKLKLTGQLSKTQTFNCLF